MAQYIHQLTKEQQIFNDNVHNICCEHYHSLTVPANIIEVLPAIFVKLFKRYPHKIELDYDGLYLNKEYEFANKKENKFECTKIQNSIFIDDEDDEHNDSELNHHYTFNEQDILEDATAYNLITNYTGNELSIIRYEENPIIIFGDNIKTIFYKYQSYLYLLSYTEDIHSYIKENVVTVENDDDNRYFDYVVYGNHGFNTTELPIKRQNINLNDNYNDDLPHEQIKEFIENADAGLCILHGKPGTGKTTYIRHIMRECKDTNFMVLNTSCFDMITDPSFVSLIADNQGSVVILEDCEDMLAERSGNSRIATLLNLSDGILGDALRLKFICTFNANIGKIDPAILRKGRTHIKYEFKELAKDKAELLAKKIGIQLPEHKGNHGYSLADIYNASNDLVNDTTTKVGFSKS